MTQNKSQIHPAAIVEPGAKIGSNVTIEAYAIVKGTVTVCDNATIKSHAYIDGYTTIGEGTTIWPSASIGTQTQDLKFHGEKTFVEIGKNTHIREFVTINSSCQEGSVVRVGDNCLIMAYCHVAHNCQVGNHVIMSNSANLAGYVKVDDHVVIGGLTPVHQYSRIGKHSMVGGLSRVTHDIPPFTIGGGVPFKLGGLNIIGLKRKGFPIKTRRELSKAFRIMYRSGLTIENALERIEKHCEPTDEVLHWLDFCRSSKRGLIGLHGITRLAEEGDELEEEFDTLEDDEVMSHEASEPVSV